MNIKIVNNHIILRTLIIVTTFFSVFSPNIIFANNVADGLTKVNLVGQDEYYTDSMGNIFIYVNVIGHVKKPGTFLVDEKADILTIISQAGGPLQGSKLNKIFLYYQDGEKNIINLDDYFNSGTFNYKIKPNSTIYIEETLFSYILSKTGFLTALLQIINIYIALS